MVQALVSLSDNCNRVLNVVKAKYELKDKGQAIEFLVKKYIEAEEDPELRPEFIKRIKSALKEKTIKVDDFAKKYGLKDV